MWRYLLVLGGVTAACGKSEPPAPAPGSATVASDATRADAPAPPDAAPVDAGSTSAPAASAKVLQIVSRGRVACGRRADGRVRCWGKQGDGKRTLPPTTPIEIPELIDAVALDFSVTGVLYVVTSEGTLLRGTLEPLDGKPLERVDGIAEPIDVRVLGQDALVLTRTGDLHLLAAKGAISKVTTDVIALGGVDMISALHRDGRVTIVPARAAVRGVTDAVGLFGAGCAHRRSGGIACWDRKGRAVKWAGAANIVDRVAAPVLRCDLTASGIACMGQNRRGQLGTGAGPDRLDPKTVAVPGKPIALAAGDHTVYALLESGEVAGWGGNESGQLADGTLIDRPTPQLIAGLTTPQPPSPSTAPPGVPQSEIAMDWTGLPATCKQPRTLLGPNGEKLEVVSAYAYREPSRVSVWFADFRLEPAGSWFPPARGTQQVFELTLRKGTSRNKTQPIDRGRYRNKGPRISAFTMYEGNYVATYEHYDLVVEQVDATWICGQLLDEDGKHQPFAARFMKR